MASCSRDGCAELVRGGDMLRMLIILLVASPYSIMTVGIGHVPSAESGMWSAG
jgi:hypothetical protein